MSPIRSLPFALGCIMALSSCSVFKKDPAPAEDPYAAANPYAAGTQNQGYPAYGNTNTGGYDAANAGGQPPAAGGYAPPVYSQPPAGSYPPPAGGGYGGAGYTATAGSGNTGGNYAAASGSGRTHTVVSGDNLTKISRRYGVSVDALMRANNLNSDLIRQGQNLTIP